MVLETIWFFLWGLLWAIYFITDGFDLGVGGLIPFLGQTDEEKQAMYHSIGPVWDGNEVWLITAGGVTFAAFPLVYAVMFSSMYSALMLILFALIIRGVSIEFRHQNDSPAWRTGWDICMCLGSVLPSFLLGVAFANIFQGIPFDAKGVFHGNLITFLNPYGLLGGLLFSLLFLMHGAIWLTLKTSNELQKRANEFASVIWPGLVFVILFFIAASKYATQLFNNYMRYPILYLIIVMGVSALIIMRYYLFKNESFKAFIASAIVILSCTFFGIVGLFPVLFPSSINESFHLTAHNASSSPLTLSIMLGVVIVFIPIVIGYQLWSYNLFNEKVDLSESGY